MSDIFYLKEQIRELRGVIADIRIKRGQLLTQQRRARNKIEQIKHEIKETKKQNKEFYYVR